MICTYCADRAFFAHCILGPSESNLTTNIVGFQPYEYRIPDIPDETFRKLGSSRAIARPDQSE